MPRLFVSSIPTDVSTVSIKGEQARYVSDVLRLRQGDDINVFDSLGTHCRAVIIKTGRGWIELEVKEHIEPPDEPPVNIILLQGMLKGQKMDMVLQKTTELGIGGIVPIVTERVVVRSTRKLERWKRIAHEASRQCGRRSPPEVSRPRDFEDYLSSEACLNGIIFWEEQGQSQKSLRDMEFDLSLQNIVVAVGPEGGFTTREIALAEKRGLVPVTLGPRILRAETAAITAVALMQHISGGLG